MGPVLFLSAQTDAVDHSHKDGPLRYTLIHEGVEREYFVWLPRNFDANKTWWPLVIAHGGGTNTGRSFWLTPKILDHVNRLGMQAILLTPTFDQNDPNREQFPVLGGAEFLQHVLDDARKHYKLEPKILLTGYSRGAQFAHRYTLWYPDLVHACAPLASGSWTTPDGRFFMYGLGEIENPETFLLEPEHGAGLKKAQQQLFNPQVAALAGKTAEAGAENIPFLVMCGFLDVRLEITRSFVCSLNDNGFSVETAWPKTPHVGRDVEAYRTEFDEFARITTHFFYRMTDRGGINLPFGNPNTLSD